MEGVKPADSVVVVLMGVSGCGKSTVGRKLAGALGWEFVDGDDVHPPENVAKMAAGIALDDRDRDPWLAALRRRIQEFLDRGRGAVVACSALKEAHRWALRADPRRVRIVFLHGDRETIRGRIERRTGHYMKAALLDSQFAALEPPADALRVDVALAPGEIVEIIGKGLGLAV